jgi:hypothetical protein
VLQKLRLELGSGACFVEVTAVSNCEKLRLEIDLWRRMVEWDRLRRLTSMLRVAIDDRGAIVRAQFVEERLKLRSQNWLPHEV